MKLGVVLSIIMFTACRQQQQQDLTVAIFFILLFHILSNEISFELVSQLFTDIS